MDSSGYNRIEFLGNSCGQHGSYTFYRGIRYWKDDKCHSLSLGEFFHGQMNSSDHVIPLVGELQLLWEEKHHEGLKLSSVRLYVLPEDCPIGRLPGHGQDEILAEDEKIVLKVEDLMKLVISEPVFWPKGLLATHKTFPQIDLACRVNGFKTNVKTNIATLFRSSSRECKDDEHNDSKGTRVVILSYARYCRYRAALKRFEGCANRWLADFLVSAIGGFSTSGRETRVIFCRSTVEHPVVENYECRMNHLAPSLKGRKRKKRPKSKPNESEDSNESETNSEKNVQRCALTAEGVLGKRWPKEKLSELSKPKPKAKKNLLHTEEGFLKRLHQYMNDQGTPIVRIPILGFKEVNLFQFYECTQQLGGYDTVTERRLWKLVYDQLGGSPGNTSAATGTRKNYEKLLLEFERHIRSRKQPSSAKVELKKPVSLDERLSASTALIIASGPTDQEINTSAADGGVSASVLDTPMAPKSETVEGQSDDSEVRPVESSNSLKNSVVAQTKPTIQMSNRRKKLLRKTPILAGNNIKKNAGSDQAEKSFADKRKDVGYCSPSADSQHVTAAVSSDVKSKPSNNHRHVDMLQVNSKVTSIIPCTVSLEIIKDKTCKRSEMPPESSFDEVTLPVKAEKPEPFVTELTYLSVADADIRLKDPRHDIGKTASPLLEPKCNESQNDTLSVGLSSKPQKLQPSSSSESIGADNSASVKSLANLIEASSISRKLLSGGHAVIEEGSMLDKSPSGHFLSGKLDACAPNVIPVKHLGNELSKSLADFKDVSVSPYTLGVRASISTPPGQSSLNIDDSSLNFSRTSLKVESNMEHLPALSIPFPFGIGRSNEDKPRIASGKCQSVGAAIRSSEADCLPSLKKHLLQSASKRIHPIYDPPLESRLMSAKKHRSDSENCASAVPFERNPQLHRSSVISSPIKRFIDGTKSWIPPHDPNQTIGDVQNLSWSTPDDQPTDLSMKTLMSRKTATDLPQDEPLDLSKPSKMYCMEKNKAGVKPVVLPGCNVTVPGPVMLKNGHTPSTSTNKVAFVTPSLRSAPSFMPATSYQMSGLHSATTLTSSSLPQDSLAMRPEQMAPLMAYAPSFHPAFQILSAPILSAIATPSSLLSSNSATSPSLAVPFFPVIPIAQNASSSLSADRTPEIGNPFLPSVLKRSSKK